MDRIPVLKLTSSDNVQTIIFDYQSVTLRFYWNVRANCFFLDVTDTNSNTLYGIKVVPNWPLLQSYKGHTDFRGDIIVLPNTNNFPTEITWDNFGTNWFPWFMSTAELVQWEDYYGLA